MVRSQAERDIYDRTEEYALRAIKLFRHLKRKRDEDGLIIGRQYLRAATSIGANMVEADCAESKKDFIHKCTIALKEARECRYWLRLLTRAEIVKSARLAGLADETQQIASVLATIVLKAKRNRA